MKKASIVLILTFIIVSLQFQTVNAASNSNSLARIIRTLIANTETSLDDLESAYQLAGFDLDEIFASAKDDAEDSFNNEMVKPNQEYALVVPNAKKMADDSMRTFQNIVGIRLNSSLFNAPNADKIFSLLICPDTALTSGFETAKRLCNNVNNKPRPGDLAQKVTDKQFIQTDEWHIGEVAFTTYEGSVDPDFISAISNSLFNFSDPVMFLALQDQARVAIGKLTYATQNFNNAKQAAQRNRDLAIKEAENARYSKQIELDSKYLKDKSTLNNRIDFLNCAILAIEDVKKEKASFEKTFPIALKYEYNNLRLNELNSRLLSPDKVDAFGSGYDSVHLNQLIASLKNRFSISAANSFNRAIGNTFLQDINVKISFKLIADSYKKISGVVLKF